MEAIVPIELLRSGEVGEIVEISGEERLVNRLAEKGFRKGSRCEMLCPGCPFVCLIDETRLSIRTDGLVEVLVSLRAN